jgi:hypothetical protein
MTDEGVYLPSMDSICDGLGIPHAKSRAIEILKTPITEVPPLALEFAKVLIEEHGCVTEEILILAYVAYAQCVENLPCYHYELAAREEDWVWFRGK